MWLVLASVAFALPFRITPSPGATLEVLPSVEQGRTEILVRGNEADLEAELGDIARPGIRVWTVTDIGTSWVLNVWMSDPATRLELRREGDTWLGLVRPSTETPAGSLLGPEVSPDQLLAQPVGTGACPDTIGTALVPLTGADMLHHFAPSDFEPELPRWTAAEPDKGAGWGVVPELQRALSVVRAPRERALLHYQLGALHRDLGHAREAAHYFREAAAYPDPAGVARIQRAGALLSMRRWEEARTEALAAGMAGAPDVAVLEVAGVAALLGDDVAAAPIGRALARRTARPSTSLVAGALLLRAHCNAEAVPVLGRARLLLGSRDAMGKILLADAQLGVGDREGASSTLGRIEMRDVPDRWRGMVRARNRLIAMLAVTPEQWPAFVPMLAVAADRWDDEGVESLYLLGQVGERLGDARLAEDSYGALLDRSRGLASSEPGRRLLLAWERRLGELLAESDDMRAVAFHTGAWRPALAARVEDPSLLRAVAERAMKLGLYDPALVTLREVASIEGQRRLDDRRTLLALADIYRATGRFEAALETLDFLRRRPRDPALALREQLLRARTLEAQGAREAARRSYTELGRALGGSGSAAEEGRLRAALLDAEDGRCAQALPVLERITTYPADLSAGLTGIARSRCLFAAGRVEDARVVAAAAVTTLSAPQVGAYADYLARLGAGASSPLRAAVTAATSAPVLIAPAAATAGGAAAPGVVAPARKDVWTRLLEEEEADAALRSRIPRTLVRK